ncbi:ergothioneine biosynthesis protein EgtB [Anaeromyxobacter paludicola]|uniref:Ergothioneine biosynthesis protein EgtB n=1 Tax=Anaeromyxobacter paludicola TaxID=2918171 RepID=A0ABN6N7C5_9BACT|nr:ergothioneine biosynthesis protein EgtB [Anaeromyxobacter paludicola]BDG07934.1 ergothioneine biosynthesis protein EgtB [Anaeromyxobacter paludicola]
MLGAVRHLTFPEVDSTAAQIGAGKRRGEPDRARAATLRERFDAVRRATLALAAPLSPEDQQVQSMPDASPVKWHLAHTTWFFEEFVLSRALPRRPRFHPRFAYLFNSYYEAVGPRHERPRRGLLTRPSLAEVHAYRAHVDAGVGEWLDAGRCGGGELDVLELGLHHEQQHQELVLTDVKHALFQNPLRPAWRADLPGPSGAAAGPLRFEALPGGLVEVGDGGAGFAFDNERPRHRAFLEPFALAARPVSNGEVAEFVAEGGYRRPELWLSDGFAAVKARGWEAPLYWEPDGGGFAEFTLAGTRPLDLDAPAAHLSFFEADAVARFLGARLPTEEEWEAAASGAEVAGNLAEAGRYHPCAAASADGPGQLFGDVWEWTRSAYAPYPGFAPAPGALGEYNGKFMVSQLVLRGGSAFTPASHLRPTYRNFFYPDARWQLAGLRVAKDLR